MKQGFTIIELLIASTIISILTGVLFVNYRGYTASEQVRQTAYSLKSDLRLYQTQSQSGKTIENCADLVGYQFGFSATSYTITAICDAPDSPYVIKTVTLPGNVIFRSINTFMFSTTSTDLSQAYTLQIQDSTDTSRYYELRLSTKGVLNDVGYVQVP